MKRQHLAMVIMVILLVGAPAWSADTADQGSQTAQAFTNFKDGHRYEDFDPGIDQVAAYGLAALVGGKVATKAGLLAKLGSLLVAFKKVIIIAVIAVAGLFAKLFKRRKLQPAA